MDAAAPLRASLLRAEAEALGQSLPALLAEAEHLASTLMLGAHGRRRAGHGAEFWQYRPAQAGDAASMIDWRRSAQSDGAFVREREWQLVQTVSLWIDSAQSMAFGSGQLTKLNRARLIALALAVLLLRGGERVGLIGGGMPRHGRAQIAQILAELGQSADEYGAASAPAHTGRAVYLSDFLGPLEAVKNAMQDAAARGVRGCIIQILDPAEESFPYQGRIIFESMAGSLRHETNSAADLRARYLERLAQRKEELADLCRRMGWLYTLHLTDAPVTEPLLWAYNALEQGG